MWMQLLNQAQFQPNDTMLQMNPAQQMQKPMGVGSNAPLPGMGGEFMGVINAGQNQPPPPPQFAGLGSRYRGV